MPEIQRLLSIPFGVSALLTFTNPVLGLGEELPFRAHPVSFQHWLNKQYWGGGSQIVFDRLYDCVYTEPKLENEQSPRYIEAWKKYNELLGKDYSESEKYRRLSEKFMVEDAIPAQAYECKGYIQITNPKGRWVCDVTAFYVSNHNVWRNQQRYPANSPKSQYFQRNCVMQF